MNSHPQDFSGNVARFTGFADLYDAHRPSPPAGLAELIAQRTAIVWPEFVVDLGSGTGLSTRYWTGRADRVVGLEPSPDMRRQAEAATSAPNVSYRDGLSHETHLPERCADVVVCMQALHWMEPGGTFAEAARILRPGGAFVACDYDWPPQTGHAEADAAFATCIRLGRDLEQRRGIADAVRHWPKEGHYERMRASDCFRSVSELTLPHIDNGHAARLVALLLSQGYIMALLRAGMSESELGIDQLRTIAARTLGSHSHAFRWTARVRLAIV